ncbi:Peptidyl-tRNA hydrolase [Colletotrichum spinosum]|uniref:peptidyl-tRNA hydrolase n=1 Tax=Colletotrichum spinosum TaxID=1347390 RepID=A0A4R8Q391_9PEZI|nr:Peptidyl-tRNA hydrolase [Colletotrichum spinosum]
MTHLFKPRFLIISLGNPAPYTDTLHSAGHHALQHLKTLLEPAQPRFERTNALGKKPCKASLGEKYMLAQCPTLMNISGRFVANAWKAVQEAEKDHSNLHLVVVHDDLEEELGVVKMRQWSRSPKGHNGIKSIKSSLNEDKYPDAKWSRISIGIGRPESREKDVISKYVLRPMTDHELQTLEEKTGQGVLKCLSEWEKELAKAKPAENAEK